MNKRKKSKFWVVALTAGLLLYFTYTVFNQQKLIYSKDIEMKNIQAKIDEEKKLNEDLKKERESLDSDEYIEKVARDKLGMVKSGERIFIDMDN